MKITKRSRFFWLLGLLALVLAFGVILAGCDASTVTIGGGLILGGIIGGSVDHVFIGIIIGGIIGFIVFIIITPSGNTTSGSKGANDLFIELNKGSTLTIKDEYIYGPRGNKLGFINGSGVHSRGRQIGNINGNGIYGLDGNLICHIENGCLVK
jgi:hypothetical protein